MREFITQDGNRIPVPNRPESLEHEPAVAADPHAGIDYHCACHKRMGNDFWFLPAGSCLRDDKTCNAKVPL